MVDRPTPELRARARRMGFTIKSWRGTATGFYELCLRARDGSRNEFSLPCDGLAGIEQRLASIERALLPYRPRPSFDEATAAITAQQTREWEARERARPVLNCQFCNEPQNGEQAYRVGPEDIPDAAGIPWVHARCHDAFRDRNRRALEAKGFVGGVNIVRA